jgi:hypothetical protein
VANPESLQSSSSNNGSILATVMNAQIANLVGASPILSYPNREPEMGKKLYCVSCSGLFNRIRNIIVIFVT